MPEEIHGSGCSRPDAACSIGKLELIPCLDRTTLASARTEVRHNANVPVSRETPPTFLVQAEDDNVDGVQQSLVYFAALKKAGVPTEMHLYAHGGHAFGLRPTSNPITRWPALAETWMRTMGMIPAANQKDGGN
ncbi:alpha/beta hydrolase [Rhodanobacter umsongensis]